MTTKKPFQPGIVEGFFGHAWSWQARRDMADFMAQHGFGSYLYAPKSDSSLRSRWQHSMVDSHRENLAELAEYFRQQGLEFGIGLSPFELFRNFDSAAQQALQQKIEQINSINPHHLSLLFDDMPGNFPELAEKQAQILDFVMKSSTASCFSICPTYYSSDPVLEQVFGTMPEAYLETLGALIPGEVDIFWTGEKVISDSYSKIHLQEVSRILHRKPLIWDNYPVNDSKNLAPFLNLNPFAGRSTLAVSSAGHFSNPMNQAYLSQLPLLTMAALYSTDPEKQQITSLAKALDCLCPAPLRDYILEDIELFQQVGIEQLGAAQKLQLLNRYSALEKSPMAREITLWLQDYYAFDPACLTT